MKKLSLLLGMCILLFTTSCRDVINSVLDVLPPFNVPFSSTIDVPFAAISTTSYTRSPEIPMNIDLNKKIKDQNSNFSINNLKSVQLNSLQLEYISSELGSRLDVIKNARIYVKAPGKSEILIATAYNNTDPKTINFIVTDEEILEYFRTTENSLIVEFQANEVTLDKIKMNVNSKFNVKVQL